jgi:Glycosyl transferase family 2
MSLSLAIVTKNSARYVEPLLQAGRAIADEIVVAVDRSSTDATEAICSRYADKLYRIGPIGVVEWVLAWLNVQCSGDWILRLDDDELPSASLVAALPRLLRDREVTHYWLPRRWLIGSDRANWIAQRPWWPDWQLRLFRNIPSIVYVPGSVHTSYMVQGASRFLSEGSIYHLDLVLHSEQERRAKVERYDRLAPGRSQASFYLIPDELALLRRPLAADDPPWSPGAGQGGRRGLGAFFSPRAHQRGGVARAWSGSPVDVSFADTRQAALQDCYASPELFAATLECPECPAVLRAGQPYWLELELRNDSPIAWPFRPSSVSDQDAREQWLRAAREMYEFQGSGWPVPGLIRPGVRVAYHWLRENGETYEFDGLRTDLLHTLRPGELTTIVAQVRPPAEPGRYILRWDLVIEHVSWFSAQGWRGPEHAVRVEAEAN